VSTILSTSSLELESRLAQCDTYMHIIELVATAVKLLLKPRHYRIHSRKEVECVLFMVIHNEKEDKRRRVS
jgi:hypothetical protein